MNPTHWDTSQRVAQTQGDSASSFPDTAQESSSGAHKPQHSRQAQHPSPFFHPSVAMTTYRKPISGQQSLSQSKSRKLLCTYELRPKNSLTNPSLAPTSVIELAAAVHS